MKQSNIQRIRWHQMWTNFRLETKGYEAIEQSKNRWTCLIPIEHSKIWRYDQNVYWKSKGMSLCLYVREKRSWFWDLQIFFQQCQKYPLLIFMCWDYRYVFETWDRVLDFIVHVSGDYYMLLRYLWCLLSAASFYQNQIMHVLEKCRRRVCLVRPENYLIAYCW